MNKRLLALTTLLALATGLFAGGAKEAAPAAAETGTDTVSAEEQWAIDNGLYEDETMDALYEKAKAETGSMVVYTISSRTEKAAKEFMSEYPGLDVTVYNISSDELKEKFQREYEAGIAGADLIHSKEVLGDYKVDFFDTGILHNYMPDSIYGNVNKRFKSIIKSPKGNLK